MTKTNKCILVIAHNIYDLMAITVYFQIHRDKVYLLGSLVVK